MNAIFTSEKLEKSDKIIDEVKNMTIKYTVYELNTATASDTQGGLGSEPDTFTHTSKVILDQNLLSCWAIVEVSFLPPRTKPSIAAIILTPQKLMTPTVKGIVSYATSGNMWTNMTLRQISRTGIDRFIPISTPIHRIMSKYFDPYSSDSSVNRIPIGTSDTTNSPPCDLNVSLKIGNIWQTTTPNLRDSNNLDTSIDGEFTNNLVVPPLER